jgi:hypothetical protein
MNLLSGGTKSKYDTIKECDEMVYSFGKSWTNHRHQIFTYKVLIYVLEVRESIHNVVRKHHLTRMSVIAC